MVVLDLCTVVQEPGSYGERDLARAAEERFARTLNLISKFNIGPGLQR